MSRLTRFEEYLAHNNYVTLLTKVLALQTKDLDDLTYAAQTELQNRQNADADKKLKAKAKQEGAGA